MFLTQFIVCCFSAGTGNTFCTIETFEAVAQGVAECAFVTSELPVALSLEMHCTRKYQRKLAKMVVGFLGEGLLTARGDTA